MNVVLYHLCCHYGDLGPVPCPSTVLSKKSGLTLYKTRKILKQLKDQGLVTSGHFCIVSEERNIIINGYTITEKAMCHSEEFVAAYCKKFFPKIGIEEEFLENEK